MTSAVVAALVLGLSLVALKLIWSRLRRASLQRRAAFDIGSGACKLLIADIDATGAMVGSPLFEAEKPCAFKADAQCSDSGALSEEIRDKGISLIAELAAKARQIGATQTCGIATEIFRTAPNGLTFLREVERLTRVRISTLSQDDEARLGLATAEALATSSSRFDAAWDSGGGSFQITARLSPGSWGRTPIARAALRTYVGKLGTGPSYQRLVVNVLRRPYGARADGVNPVSAADAEALVACLVAELPPPPAWLDGGHVVAIGAFNCIFAVTLRALRLLGPWSAGIHAAVPDAKDASTDGTLTIGDARDALRAVCDRTDAQLGDVAGRGPDAEPAHLVVPKVALLVAVATHLNLGRISYRRFRAAPGYPNAAGAAGGAA